MYSIRLALVICAWGSTPESSALPVYINSSEHAQASVNCRVEGVWRDEGRCLCMWRLGEGHVPQRTRFPSQKGTATFWGSLVLLEDFSTTMFLQRGAHTFKGTQGKRQLTDWAVSHHLPGIVLSTRTCVNSCCPCTMSCKVGPLQPRNRPLFVFLWVWTTEPVLFLLHVYESKVICIFCFSPRTKAT